MPLAKVDISLLVQNNRNYPLDMNIMSSPVNALDTSNALTEYRYDFTAFTFTNENQVTIQYKPAGAAVFSIYTATLQSATLDAVVLALNALNIGYFNSYVELGATYIGTNNDNYTFGDLSVIGAGGGGTVITMVFYGTAGTTNDAVSCALLITPASAIYSYSNPAIGVILYSVNTAGVLSAPLTGNNTVRFVFQYLGVRYSAWTDGTGAIQSMVSCSTAPMRVAVINNAVSSINAFTAIMNTSNVTALTSINLAGGGAQTDGLSTTYTAGINNIELVDASSTSITVLSIVDYVTSAPVFYTVTSGQGSAHVFIDVTLMSGNITDGIIITVS